MVEVHEVLAVLVTKRKTVLQERADVKLWMLPPSVDAVVVREKENCTAVLAR